MPAYGTAAALATAGARDGRSSGPHLVLRLLEGAALHQQLSHVRVSVLAGAGEGGDAVLVHCLDVGADVEQEQHKVEQAHLGGDDERRFAVLYT